MAFSPALFARSAANTALRFALTSSILLFLGLGLLPRTGLYRTTIALSGSMRPAFAPTDLLILRPEPMRAVRVGQIITYAIPVGDRHVESHRVVSVTRRAGHTVVRTKGDANNAVDPWTAELTGTRVWYVAGHLKGDGGPLLALRSPDVRLALLYGAPALLVAFGLARIWRPGHVALET